MRFDNEIGDVHAIGCHLHWNSFETCWDCPCHGSQFAVDGTALNAPAIRALDEVKTEE
jgi:Rieske Fe-S protein